jgi:hypothetical protein
LALVRFGDCRGYSKTPDCRIGVQMMLLACRQDVGENQGELNELECIVDHDDEVREIFLTNSLVKKATSKLLTKTISRYDQSGIIGIHRLCLYDALSGRAHYPHGRGLNSVWEDLSTVF